MIEIKNVNVSVENVKRVHYTEQYYGDNKYMVIEYFTDDDVWIKVADWDEYAMLLYKLRQEKHRLEIEKENNNEQN